MRYFVIKHQVREDGEVNVSETSRSTYANALSYYHERFSKMCVNETFVSVALLLVDENLNVLRRELAKPVGEL